MTTNREAPVTAPDLSIPEYDDLHCPTCGKEWVWHGRDEKQRVCDECRYAD